jgi:adenosine deaminase
VVQYGDMANRIKGCGSTVRKASISCITSAVFQAGADRIGHGVDIAFETEALRTLDYMAAQKIAVEINLTSNEFILGVKDGSIPLGTVQE